MIRDAIAGKTICVTGTTGFLGKSVVEKLLRAVPEVRRIHLALRASPRRPAEARLEREILASPAFQRCRDEVGEERFASLAAEKLGVLELDLGRDGLGLDEAGRAALRECDVLIHSANMYGQILVGLKHLSQAFLALMFLTQLTFSLLFLHQ